MTRYSACTDAAQKAYDHKRKLEALESISVKCKCGSLHSEIRGHMLICRKCSMVLIDLDKEGG